MARDYRAEYRRRIERGLAQGLTRSQAAGHKPRRPDQYETETLWAPPPIRTPEPLDYYSAYRRERSWRNNNRQPKVRIVTDTSFDGSRQMYFELAVKDKAGRKVGHFTVKIGNVWSDQMDPDSLRDLARNAKYDLISKIARDKSKYNTIPGIEYYDPDEEDIEDEGFFMTEDAEE